MKLIYQCNTGMKIRSALLSNPCSIFLYSKQTKPVREVTYLPRFSRPSLFPLPESLIAQHNPTCIPTSNSNTLSLWTTRRICPPCFVYFPANSYAAHSTSSSNGYTFVSRIHLRRHDKYAKPGSPIYSPQVDLQGALGADICA
mgnify:CR=1 FL=1